MKPGEFLKLVIRPSLLFCGPRYSTISAQLMLLAIALHESQLIFRWQLDRNGQRLENLARGFWQFELNGVKAVMANGQLRWLDPLTYKLGYPAEFSPPEFHHALAFDPILACCFARAMLWCVPGEIPTAPGKAYAYYLKAWRPGARRPDDWARDFAIAGDNINVV